MPDGILLGAESVKTSRLDSKETGMKLGWSSTRILTVPTACNALMNEVMYVDSKTAERLRKHCCHRNVTIRSLLLLLAYM